MKSISIRQITFGFLGSAVLFATACTSDPNSAGVEFMPDMYRSTSYETYGEAPDWSKLTDSTIVMGVEARQPAMGSIPRGGYMPYPYGDSDAERTRAAAEVTAPADFPFTDEVVAAGKVDYQKFCVHCHGKKGQGDGLVVKQGGHAPPTPYDGQLLKDISEGQIYHAIMRGKNMMGSHASQIEESDRWEIVRYVQSLQGKEVGSETTATDAEGAEAEEDELAKEAAGMGED